MRVYIIGSPWHAVIALAMSHNIESVGYIIEKVSESSLAAILNLFKRAGADHKIYKILAWDDIAIELLYKKYRYAFVYYMYKNIRKYRSCFAGKDDIEEVFLFNINSPVSRCVLKGMKSGVKIAKVEDGVVDYLNFKYTDTGSLYYNTARALFVLLTGTGYIYRRNHLAVQKLIETQYAFFPTKIGCINSASILDLMEYKVQIQDVLALVRDHEWTDDNCADAKVLFIGQSLYEDNSMPLDDEVRFYLEEMEKLVKKYGKVIFKPHPRTTYEKKVALCELIGNRVDIIYYDVNVPVEALLVNSEISVVVGMWSNPIIYGRKLFDIQTSSLMFKLDRRGISPLLHKVHCAMIDIFQDDYQDLGYD